MGGLVGIGFSIRINPTHTTIHVFITTFRASRLCLIPKIGARKMFGFRMAEHKSRCTVPKQPTGHAGCSFKRVRKGTLIDDSVRPEENCIRIRFLSHEGAAFTLLFLFENGHGLLASLPQEKFQNPHFGFKKGNNWDFKGISLGKPKIGKVLPKPSMGF